VRCCVKAWETSFPLCLTARFSAPKKKREKKKEAVVLWVCYLGNQYFLYRQSEAGNENYGYELHARSGLRFIIRQDPANLQHTVASPKTKVPQDLSTHAKVSICFQKASE
jgi:hypothetical protein